MFLLRVGRRGRWGPGKDPGNPAHLAEAAKDLTLAPDEEGLSVFRVEDDPRDVALRFALTCRERPAHLDYVLFPDDLAVHLHLIVQPSPRADLDLVLSTRHYEIHGLTAELSSRLAAAILASSEHCVERLHERDLLALGAELCRRDPELLRRLRGEWATRLSTSGNQSEPLG